MRVKLHLVISNISKTVPGPCTCRRPALLSVLHMCAERGGIYVRTDRRTAALPAGPGRCGLGQGPRVVGALPKSPWGAGGSTRQDSDSPTEAVAGSAGGAASAWPRGERRGRRLVRGGGERAAPPQVRRGSRQRDEIPTYILERQRAEHTHLVPVSRLLTRACTPAKVPRLSFAKSQPRPKATVGRAPASRVSSRFAFFSLCRLRRYVFF